VIGWARDVGPRVSRAMEMMVVLHRDWMGIAGPTLAVIPPTYAGSEAEAAEALALPSGACPARGARTAARLGCEIRPRAG